MHTVTTPASRADAVREARRELKRAERSLSRAEIGSAFEGLARERMDAATIRFISLTGPASCRGAATETPDEHREHARQAAH